MGDTVKRSWGRHKKLLEDPDVKRWCDNIARGSVATAEIRLRRLGVYCERVCGHVPLLARRENHNHTCQFVPDWHG